MPPIQDSDGVVGSIPDPRFGYITDLAGAVLSEANSSRIVYGPRESFYNRLVMCSTGMITMIVIDELPKAAACNDQWFVRAGQCIVVPNEVVPKRIIITCR